MTRELSQTTEKALSNIKNALLSIGKQTYFFFPQTLKSHCEVCVGYRWVSLSHF